MLVDNDTRIKYKDGFISRVYYQDNIVYEGYVNITVNVTIQDNKGSITLFVDGRRVDIYTPRYVGGGRYQNTFYKTYTVNRGAVISFEWNVSRGYEIIYSGFDTTGTVVNEDSSFGIGIQKKNAGGDIM